MALIRVSIIGATGYTGEELVRILSRHPEVKLVALTSQSYVGEPFDKIYPNLRGFTSLACVEQDLPAVVEASDVVFVALPHGMAVPVAQEVLRQGKKVIDLGADFRFDRAEVYQKWYKVEHGAPELLEQAVYGLPEINRERIRGASIIGNPGCYPTSALLALAPLLGRGLIDNSSIVIDSKSGVSGAGRTLALGSHYAEVNENVKAYNVAAHRHTPEIEQEVSKMAGEGVVLSFTPHLMPMTRGILSTVYAKMTKELTAARLYEIYQEFYRGEVFVQVLPLGELPQTKWAYGSNRCFLGLTVDPRTGRVIIVSAIDNLVKGASGQAVQNMNLLFGLPETTALEFPGIWP